MLVSVKRVCLVAFIVLPGNQFEFMSKLPIEAFYHSSPSFLHPPTHPLHQLLLNFSTTLPNQYLPHPHHGRRLTWQPVEGLVNHVIGRQDFYGLLQRDTARCHRQSRLLP
jgi:hypothetical protein